MRDRVLVVGSGGREHALAWKLAQSPSVGKVFIAPGNGGTEEVGENVAINPLSFLELANFSEDERVSLVVVGSESLLAAGITDAFRARDFPVFGPASQAMEIEGSKAFAKNLMKKTGIPTADFRIFYRYDEALAYVREKGAPLVVKASGLALGKGVYLCADEKEAEDALQKIMVERVHGDAGDAVVVEEKLFGQEVSVHALSDGMHFKLFPLSQDHKAADDGDRGPMTGGMGAIAPLPQYDAKKTLQRIGKEIVGPLLTRLRYRGTPFRGCFFPGIKMTEAGPMVLEVNARFGDPEMQAYALLLESDLYEILSACAQGTLKNVPPLSWRKGYAVCVVLASGGYPGAYTKGIPIAGLKEVAKLRDVAIFHAGTVRDTSGGALLTSGGRVLGVTAFGETIDSAIGLAYEAAKRISFTGMHCRQDIGAKAQCAII